MKNEAALPVAGNGPVLVDPPPEPQAGARPSPAGMHGRPLRSSGFVRRMALLGITLLLITMLLLLPGISFRRSREAQGWVEHELRVLNAAEYVLSTMQDAETSERGYLLTGDTSYLAPFQSAVSNQLQAMPTLRRLTADNSAQQEQIGKLEGLAVDRLAELTRTIALYDSKGSKAAARSIDSNDGVRIMGEIRNLILRFEHEEYRLLGVRTRAAETHATSMIWILRVGGVLLIVALIAFGAVGESDYRDQRRAEALLQSNEEQFHTLANAIPQLCWIANADGWIFWYNQRWFDFTGTTLKDMAGWGWQSVHDPKALPVIMESWKKAIVAGQPWEMVFRLRAADGTFHPFLTRVTPVRDRSGKVARWFGTNTDITSQLATENALRENEERLRLAHEVAHIGTFEWDLQTGLKQRTPELEAMCGVSCGAFSCTQKTWMDMACPEDQKQVREKMQKAMETGSFEAEWRVVCPNGQEHWHFGRARVVKGDTGQPIRVIGAIVDVTGRKQAEMEVQRINVHLEQLVRNRTAELDAVNKELAAFAYSVSHDLRAPLRGIDGWSLALLQDYGPKLDDGARQYLNRVRSETQRMGQLIDATLQLCRVTRDEMKSEKVDLTALANVIAARLREAEPQRAIEFIIAPGLTAKGDPRLLEIALTNLLGNAVKFTGKRDKARIEFGSGEKESKPAFYVRDNGVGFDMAYAGNLFGAFQRLHKVSEFPGTGIGLAMVQRVVARHGGRVWAEGQVDHGATLWFTLEGGA